MRRLHRGADGDIAGGFVFDIEDHRRLLHAFARRLRNFVADQGHANAERLLRQDVKRPARKIGA